MSDYAIQLQDCNRIIACVREGAELITVGSDDFLPGGARLFAETTPPGRERLWCPEGIH